MVQCEQASAPTCTQMGACVHVRVHQVSCWALGGTGQ